MLPWSSIECHHISAHEVYTCIHLFINLESSDILHWLYMWFSTLIDRFTKPLWHEWGRGGIRLSQTCLFISNIHIAMSTLPRNCRPIFNYKTMVTIYEISTFPYFSWSRLWNKQMKDNLGYSYTHPPQNPKYNTIGWSLLTHNIFVLIVWNPWGVLKLGPSKCPFQWR